MFKLIAFTLISLISFISPSTVLAAPTAWTGRCVGTGSASDVATIQGFECLFYNVLQVIVGLAGLAFFFMFISGGFSYLFSSGDEKKVAAASSTLTMAIVGLVGVIASWLILKIIERFTGVTLTNFVIPGP
jgi:hypothetical protein